MVLIDIDVYPNILNIHGNEKHSLVYCLLPLCLGIGLCFLGKQEAAEAMTAALEVLADPFQSMAKTLVDICAYAGTGNVLKIQNLLHICR